MFKEKQNMKYMRIILLIIVMFGLTIDWSNSLHSKIVLENLITMTIDGFETKGDWTIKFSKFRSKNWDGGKEREDSNKWIRWLSPVGKTKREHILPDGVLKNSALKSENTILAIKGKWDFPSFNWFVLEPSKIRMSKDGSKRWLQLVTKKNSLLPRRIEHNNKVHPNFIWITGKLKEAYVYVWGGNFNYDLEAHFQDYKGNDFILPISNLSYKGWKNLKITIPIALRQTRHKIPNTQPLKFLRFKVISDPYEDPSEFYMYIDYFHAIVDTYEQSFFGEELQFVEDYWGNGKSDDTKDNTTAEKSDKKEDK